MLKKQKNIILFGIKLVLSALMLIVMHNHSFASDVQTSDVNEVDQEQANARRNITYQKRPRYIYVEKRSNGWVWAGFGLFFQADKNLSHLIHEPTLDFQFGIGKAFYNFSINDFLYFAFIFDAGFQSKRLLNNNSSTFYAYDEQFLLGYEHFLDKKAYTTAFLEAGLVYQQRSFSIGPTTSNTIDFIFADPFGFTANGGFNFRIIPRTVYNREASVTYLFRLAMNFMYSGGRTHLLNYNNKEVNVGGVSYEPSLSFGVRF